MARASFWRNRLPKRWADARAPRGCCYAAPVPWNRLHYWVGLAAFAGFIASGVYLKLRLPELAAHNDSIRWMFRSNHIYILLSGLVNLSLARDGESAARWRGWVRTAGSVLALAAP